MKPLPDSAEKRELIKYLERKIMECEDKTFRYDGTRLKEFWIAQGAAYKDILKRIS